MAGAFLESGGQDERLGRRDSDTDQERWLPRENDDAGTIR